MEIQGGGANSLLPQSSAVIIVPQSSSITHSGPGFVYIPTTDLPEYFDKSGITTRRSQEDALTKN